VENKINLGMPETESQTRRMIINLGPRNVLNSMYRPTRSDDDELRKETVSRHPQHQTMGEAGMLGWDMIRDVVERYFEHHSFKGETWIDFSLKLSLPALDNYGVIRKLAGRDEWLHDVLRRSGRLKFIQAKTL
jgi:hypothetical protein